MSRKYSHRAHVEPARGCPGHVHHMKFILNETEEPDLVVMLVVRTPIDGDRTVEQAAAYAQKAADAVRTVLEDLEAAQEWF